MEHNTRNFHAHGGSGRRPSEASAGEPRTGAKRLRRFGTPGAIGAHGAKKVVGGKLTFLPGATVEGAEGLFDLPKNVETQLPALPDSTATTVAALREDYNALLAALRASDLMAAPKTEPSGDDASTGGE